MRRFMPEPNSQPTDRNQRYYWKFTKRIIGFEVVSTIIYPTEEEARNAKTIDFCTSITTQFDTSLSNPVHTMSAYKIRDGKMCTHAIRVIFPRRAACEVRIAVDRSDIQEGQPTVMPITRKTWIYNGLY